MATMLQGDRLVLFREGAGRPAALGSENHLLVTSAMTPVDDFTTRIWAVISLRLRVASRLVAPLVTPLANRILRQDRAVLDLQSQTIRRFGGSSSPRPRSTFSAPKSGTS